MGISKKIYLNILSIKGITQRKSFKISFMTIMTFLMFFMTFNSYAQEETISPDWSGTQEFCNNISGVKDGKQDNVVTGNCTHVEAGAWTAAVLLDPSVSPDYVTVLDNPRIPSDLKAGLIGLADSAGTALYANYPLINIPQHLAQRWVPGYEDSTTSLYAAESHPSGYSVLSDSGIAGLWTRTLNLSYLFFVVVMIVAGFMIMFRHKLGGQTMVTLANVLPRVISALIFATFSFAIAGLVIDLGGIVMNLIAYIYEGVELNSISKVSTLMASVLNTKAWTLTGAGGLTAYVFSGLGLKAITAKAVAAGAAATGFLPFLLGAVGAVGIIALILAVVILGIFFVGALKVIITLFKAYIQLLLAVILGPIQITLGALPGSSHAIKNWLLSILRNVMVFPVVFAIVNLPNALAASDKILVSFPGKLVNEDPSAYYPEGIDANSGFFILVMKIFVLYFAAQAPKFLEKWFPPDSSRAMQEGYKQTKDSLQKIPLVGGMFK